MDGSSSLTHSLTPARRRLLRLLRRLLFLLVRLLHEGADSDEEHDRMGDRGPGRDGPPEPAEDAISVAKRQDEEQEKERRLGTPEPLAEGRGWVSHVLFFYYNAHMFASGAPRPSRHKKGRATHHASCAGGGQEGGSCSVTPVRFIPYFIISSNRPAFRLRRR